MDLTGAPADLKSARAAPGQDGAQGGKQDDQRIYEQAADDPAAVLRRPRLAVPSQRHRRLWLNLARAADPPIKIGFSMALTGGLAGAGKPALIAMEIWRDDINAKGGLLGREVEFVYYDDQTQPANVPKIYTKLLNVDTSTWSSRATAPIRSRRRCRSSCARDGVHDPVRAGRQRAVQL